MPLEPCDNDGSGPAMGNGIRFFYVAVFVFALALVRVFFDAIFLTR